MRFKKWKLLRGVLRKTHTYKIIVSFFAVFFLIALIIWLNDPAVHTYRQSIYYCFMIASSVGNGDVIVSTTLARILTMFLSVYSLFAIAIVTGVVVSYYNAYTQMQFRDSIENFTEKLEQLPDLSEDELREISDAVKKFRMK
ncbi:MAG: two pore domain potassium channel family protein [Eubacterium sp.]|nr:two pore domain potassium channel family protein [Eubacterium sp.]